VGAASVEAKRPARGRREKGLILMASKLLAVTLAAGRWNEKKDGCR
jgi:hypothetical protein